MVEINFLVEQGTLKSIRYFMFRRIRAILFMLNKIFEVLLMLKRIRAFFFMLKKIRAVLFMLKIIIEVLFMLKRIREVLSMLKRISATPLCLAIVYLVIKNIVFDKDFIQHKKYCTDSPEHKITNTLQHKINYAE
jgi:hypothetical protein